MTNLNKKIGIIGGGQLGKMMILDAKRLGFEIITLDPDKQCPSHSISDQHIVASFHDEEAFLKLANASDVITYEFEHIDASLLEKLEENGHSIYPTAKSLRVIQNKYLQKKQLVQAGIKMPEFEIVETPENIAIFGEKFGFPLMLKATTGGYDGKGNAVIKDASQIEEKFQLLGGGKIELIAERFLDFKKEVSVLACRSINGDIVVYPVAENIHVDSILDETIVPAAISDENNHAAMKMAHDVMEIFEGVGMFCTEMFVGSDGEIYFNEVAPRPHNSGHYTIEGTLTSQYEQHIRAITGLPLGNVTLRSPIVMKNILGSGHLGPVMINGLEAAYMNPNVKVHIYGKQISKPNRKMGHLVALNTNLENAKVDARKAHEQITIQGGRQ